MENHFNPFHDLSMDIWQQVHQSDYELRQVIQDYPDALGHLPAPKIATIAYFGELRLLNYHAFCSLGLTWVKDQTLFGGHFREPSDERIIYEIR